jgi:hypothetical protein
MVTEVQSELWVISNPAMEELTGLEVRFTSTCWVPRGFDHSALLDCKGLSYK